MGWSNRKNICCCLPSVTEPLKYDNNFYLFPRRYQGFTLLYGKKDTYFPFQMHVGPDFPCMIITYSLICVPTFFFIINVAFDYGYSVIIPTLILLAMLVLAFSITACSDPGVVFEVDSDPEVPNRSRDGQTALIKCSICDIKRPVSASHCYDCGVCVDELDHHCPWTGKCIGKKNLQFYYAFITFLCIHIVFIISVFVISLGLGNDTTSYR